MSLGQGKSDHVGFPFGALLHGLNGAVQGDLQDGFLDDDFDLALSALDDLDAKSADPVVRFEGHIVSDHRGAHYKNPQSFKARHSKARTTFLTIGEHSQNCQAEPHPRAKPLNIPTLGLCPVTKQAVSTDISAGRTDRLSRITSTPASPLKTHPAARLSSVSPSRAASPLLCSKASRARKFFPIRSSAEGVSTSSTDPRGRKTVPDRIDSLTAARRLKTRKGSKRDNSAVTAQALGMREGNSAAVARRQRVMREPWPQGGSRNRIPAKPSLGRVASAARLSSIVPSRAANVGRAG